MIFMHIPHFCRVYFALMMLRKVPTTHGLLESMPDDLSDAGQTA